MFIFNKVYILSFLKKVNNNDLNQIIMVIINFVFFLKVVCERSKAFASACAIARAFPTYSRKSSKAKLPSKTVTVEFVLIGDDNTPISSEDAECMSIVAESIRLSARLVDMPCQDMHTSAFVEVTNYHNDYKF